IILFFSFLEILSFNNSLSFFNLIDPIFDNFLISLSSSTSMQDMNFYELSYYNNTYPYYSDIIDARIIPFNSTILHFKDLQDYIYDSVTYMEACKNYIDDPIYSKVFTSNVYDHIYFFSHFSSHDLYMT